MTRVNERRIDPVGLVLLGLILLLVSCFLGGCVPADPMDNPPYRNGYYVGQRAYQDQLVRRQLAHWEANPQTSVTTLVIDGECPCDRGPAERGH